jgi:hypothetical protein
MSGFTRDDNSLANGIPARHIGPETGSSGNATVTNTGGTSEGTNEAADSRPAGASGFEDDLVETGSSLDEERSFTTRRTAVHSTDGQAAGLDDLDESAAQQIADGGDRIRHEAADHHHHHHHETRAERELDAPLTEEEENIDVED